jgi:phage terminase large subunit-like protein
MSGSVIPLIKGNPKVLATAERSELLGILDHYKSMSNEWLKRQIIRHDRIDILATVVLGYEVKPFHLAMMQYQYRHPTSLQLVFRGAGKSTICTITKSIHYLLKNPNLRILIASKTSGNAEGFLKEIKAHFEGNEKLIEVFGEYFDPNKVGKWDNREIEVLPRTRHSKEASITCVGVDSTVVSKHYDVILSDDLVDEENSRTKYMRGKVRTWYYQTLDPCLEPPDVDVPHRGEHHHLGTRYHYADLYGHFIKNELEKHHQVFPALDAEGRTPWPEKYPIKWFHGKKVKAGTIIFNAQYQCDTEAMKGEIFQYDDCQPIDADKVPKKVRIFMGEDLAISQKEQNDQFAQVIVAVDIHSNYYVMYAFAKHLRFRQQVSKTQATYHKYDPIRAAVEANAYQEALYHELKDTDVEMRVIPIHTSQDKITRAWKLSSIFEDKRMFFVKDAPGVLELIDQLVMFPSNPRDDLFDALDLAIGASTARKKRKRLREEPGLI